jgi:hypothetical protein
MDIMLTLCAFAAPFIVYFLTKKFIIKYFERVFAKTGVNPITPFHQVVGFLAYLPLIVCLFNADVFENILLMVGFPLIVALVLGCSNVKMKNPITIVFTTILQIVFGGLFLVRLTIWFVLILFSVIESVLHGVGPTITYNPIIAMKMNDDGIISQKKGKFSFTPEPGEGSLNNINKYTDGINYSRYISERNRIEKELDDVRQQKQDAMIYGEDCSEYVHREAQLESELADVNKKI